MAAWMAQAIIAEGVTARQEDASLLVPAGPQFQLAGEIKNVITAVAKTHHYRDAHRVDPNAVPQEPVNPAVAAALDVLRLWASSTEHS